MAELKDLIKYIPEAVGYFQGRRAIKDEVARLREQDPVRQERIQMDPSLQQAFREGNTRGDVDQQRSIDRSVQEAIRRNPRNIAKAIEAGQTASSKTRAADNLRRIRNLQTAGTLAQRLNQLNSTIDLGNEMRERQQADRIANAEFQQRRLNMQGLKSLSSALQDGVGLMGEKEVMLGRNKYKERPEANLDGITIDQNVEPAQNRAGQGGINIVEDPETRVMDGGSLPGVTITPPIPEAIDLTDRSPDPRSVVEQILGKQNFSPYARMQPVPSRPLLPIDEQEAQAVQRKMDDFIKRKEYGDSLGYNLSEEEAQRKLLDLDNEFDSDPVESTEDVRDEIRAAGLERRLDNRTASLLQNVESEQLKDFLRRVNLEDYDIPRYRGGEGPDRILPSIYADSQLNRFSQDYDPVLRYLYDGRVREDNPYIRREGGAVVTPDGYDHDGVDINMTDAENGKFLGSVESAEMIVNAEDTNEGLRLAKKNPNNPLSKWYLNLTKRFQKEAKEREAKNNR